MIIGSCWLDLRIPGVRSLKEKRRVVKSIKEKLKSRYNISIAEVGALDVWQRSELGVVCVGTDRSRIDRVMATLVDHIRREPFVSIIDYHTEII